MDNLKNLEIDDLESISTSSTVGKLTEEEAKTISGGTDAKIKDIRLSDKIAFDRILKPEVIKIDFPLPNGGACFACGLVGLDPRLEVPNGVIRHTNLPKVNGFDPVCDYC